MKTTQLEKHKLYTDATHNHVRIQYTGKSFFQSCLGDTPVQVFTFTYYEPDKKKPLHFLHGKPCFKPAHKVEEYIN